MKRLRIVLYWISIIPPVVDLFRGAYEGLRKGLEDIKQGRTLRDDAQQQKWEEANRG